MEPVKTLLPGKIGTLLHTIAICPKGISYLDLMADDFVREMGVKKFSSNIRTLVDLGLLYVTKDQCHDAHYEAILPDGMYSLMIKTVDIDWDLSKEASTLAILFVVTAPNKFQDWCFWYNFTEAYKLRKLISKFDKEFSNRVYLDRKGASEDSFEISHFLDKYEIDINALEGKKVSSFWSGLSKVLAV